jgi:hypothetical protein
MGGVIQKLKKMRYIGNTCDMINSAGRQPVTNLTHRQNAKKLRK